jgi:hypothetical protein
MREAELYTAATVNNAAFWVLTPWAYDRERRFGGIDCLQLQVRKVFSFPPLVFGFFLGLPFGPKNESHFLQNRPQLSKLYGVTKYNTLMFSVN